MKFSHLIVLNLLPARYKEHKKPLKETTQNVMIQ